MAITPLHALLTRLVMREEGFAESAIKIAADANEAVDTNPGNQDSRPEAANLHAMVGRGQTRDQAIKAVGKLLAEAKDAVTQAVVESRFEAGLVSLGSAFHTVQDRAYHQFEEWPYDGIADAIRGDPMYMFAHGVRDLGCLGPFPFAVSRLGFTQVAGSPFQFNLQFSIPIASHMWINAGGFISPGGSARSLGFRPSLPDDSGPLGSGGMLTFTFGAPPGSQATSTPKSDLERITTGGPTAQESARDATKQFLLEIKKQTLGRLAEAGQQSGDAWEKFLKK